MVCRRLSFGCLHDRTLLIAFVVDFRATRTRPGRDMSMVESTATGTATAVVDVAFNVHREVHPNTRLSRPKRSRRASAHTHGRSRKKFERSPVRCADGGDYIEYSLRRTYILGIHSKAWICNVRSFDDHYDVLHIVDECHNRLLLEACFRFSH